MALRTLKPFDCEEAKELVVRIAHIVYATLSCHSGRISMSLIMILS